MKVNRWKSILTNLVHSETKGATSIDDALAVLLGEPVLNTTRSAEPLAALSVAVLALHSMLAQQRPRLRTREGAYGKMLSKAAHDCAEGLRVRGPVQRFSRGDDLRVSREEVVHLLSP